MLAVKGMRFPIEVILVCIRWYAAYPLSSRHLEEMMGERGVTVDHSTVSRWAIRFLPLLEKIFRKYKRPVGGSWRMDETYIKVKGVWKYLYRAVDRDGETIDFLLTAKRVRPLLNASLTKPCKPMAFLKRSRWIKVAPIKQRLMRSMPTERSPWWFVRSNISIILWNKIIEQ